MTSSQGFRSGSEVRDVPTQLIWECVFCFIAYELAWTKLGGGVLIRVIYLHMVMYVSRMILMYILLNIIILYISRTKRK